MGEQCVDVPGGHLACEVHGDPADPVVLLIAGQGQSMDWWEAAFCERLAAQGRCVVRYDHRDTGRSSTSPPGAPTYTGADLSEDPVRLLDALGVRRAHLVGLSMGGGIAQDVALRHPDRVATLTLVDTSPASDVGRELPPPEPGVLDELPEPDWTDRDAVVEHRVALERPYAGRDGLDEARYRRLATLEAERATDLRAALTNHLLASGGDEPTGDVRGIRAPTLVLHGSHDPLFPLAHGEALRDAVPGARLVVLDGGGHQQPPPHLWDLVVRELVAHTAPARDAGA
jgi:pimeloyl-ACP methyl ester carboxylesterase